MYHMLRPYATPSPTPSNASGSTESSSHPPPPSGGAQRTVRRLKWLPAELEEVYSVGLSLASVISGAGGANGSQAEWHEAKRNGAFSSGAGERSVTALRNKFAQLRKERNAVVGQVLPAAAAAAASSAAGNMATDAGGGGGGDDDEYIPPEPPMPFAPPSAGQSSAVAAAQAVRPLRPRSAAPRRARKKADSASGSELVVEEEPFDVARLVPVLNTQKSAPAPHATVDISMNAAVQTQAASRRLEEGVEWSAAEDAALLASICTLPSGMTAPSTRSALPRPAPPAVGSTSAGGTSTQAPAASAEGTARSHDIEGWRRLHELVSRTYELLEDGVPFSRTPEEIEARWENRWKADWSSGWNPLTTSLIVSALVKATIELSQIGLRAETMLSRQRTSAGNGSARAMDVPKKATTVSASMALSPPPTPATARTAQDPVTATAPAATAPATTATSTDPRLRARAQAQMRRPPPLDSPRAGSPPSLVPSSIDPPRPALVHPIAPSGRAAPPFPVRKTPTPDPLWLTLRSPASVSIPPASDRASPLPSSNSNADPIAEEPSPERPTVWMSAPAGQADQPDPPEIADSGIGIGLGIDFGHERETLERAPDQFRPTPAAQPAQSEQDCPLTAPAEESDCPAQSTSPPTTSQGTEEDEIKLVPVPSGHQEANQPQSPGSVSQDPTSAGAPPTLSTHRLSAESGSWFSRTNTYKPFSDLQPRVHVQLVPKPMEPFDFSRETAVATATAGAPASPVSIKATSEPYKPFSELTPSPPKKAFVAARSVATSLNGTPTRLLPPVLDEMLGHTPGHGPASPTLPPVSDWYEELSAAEERVKCGSKRSSPEAENDETWPARRAFHPDRIGKGENETLSPLMTVPLLFDEPPSDQEEQRYRFEYQQYLGRHLAGDSGSMTATPLDWAIATGRPMADPPRGSTPDETDNVFGAWQPFDQTGRADFALPESL